MMTNWTARGAVRTGTTWVLAWLLVALLGIEASAQGGSGPPGQNGCSPGEEGTSNPLTNDSHGLTFVGQMRELRALAIAVRGTGRVDVVRLGGGMAAVTLVGDFVVVLDRAALARSNVSVMFRGGAAFQDGVALLQIGGSTPVTMDAERVPLPVVRLAGMRRAQGSILSLEVQARGRSAFVAANFATDRVTMTQRVQ